MSWGKKWKNRYKSNTKINIDKINWRHHYRVAGGKKPWKKWYFRQLKWFKNWNGKRMSFTFPKAKEIWGWD